MRHRATRPLIDLRHRLPLATAHLLGEAAKPKPFRALMALLVVLGLGTSAYAAGAGIGGSSSRQADSAGSTASRDGERPNASRDGERPSPTDAPPTSGGRTPSGTSSASAPGTSAADQRAARGPTASPTPEDTTPPKTSLSEEIPTGNAARLSFSANEPASFSCSLDGAAYSSCESPTHIPDMSPGWHTFAVRATDAAGNVDPSPAETRWHVRGGSSAHQ